MAVQYTLPLVHGQLGRRTAALGSNVQYPYRVDCSFVLRSRYLLHSISFLYNLSISRKESSITVNYTYILIIILKNRCVLGQP